eukprot:scpid81148/ scgid22648/ 
MAKVHTNVAFRMAILMVVATLVASKPRQARSQSSSCAKPVETYVNRLRVFPPTGKHFAQGCYFPDTYVFPHRFPSTCSLRWICSPVSDVDPSSPSFVAPYPPAILEAAPTAGKEQELEECHCMKRTYDQMVLLTHDDDRQELAYRRTLIGYRHCHGDPEKCKQFMC